MSWFKNLKIKVKLMLSYLILCVLILGVGAEGLSVLKTMNENLNDLYYDSLMGISNIKDTKSNVQYARLMMQRAVLPQYKDKLPDIEKDLRDYTELTNKALKAYEEAMTNPDDKALFAELNKRLAIYRENRQELFKLIRNQDYDGAMNLYLSKGLLKNYCPFLFEGK